MMHYDLSCLPGVPSEDVVGSLVHTFDNVQNAFHAVPFSHFKVTVGSYNPRSRIFEVFDLLDVSVIEGETVQLNLTSSGNQSV